MVALRKLLGPQAIATIPGRGYRFALPVDARERRPAWTSLAPPSSERIRGNLPPSPPLFGRAQDLARAWRRCCASTRSCRSSAPAASARRAWRWRLRHRPAASFPTAAGGWSWRRSPTGAQVANSIAGSARDAACRAGRSPPEALAMAARATAICCSSSTTASTSRTTSPRWSTLLRARAPNVRLLVTSQESLKCRDEQVYRLGALAVPASAELEDAAQFGAVALFVERAHARRLRAFGSADDNVDGRGRHLPAARRHPAGHRAGGGARAAARRAWLARAARPDASTC